MKKMRSYFEKSNKGPIFIIVLVLLSLYGFTISSFLADVPSQGFSREIEIKTVKSAKQININSHVETLEISNDETLITTVDGHQFKLITISRLGEVLEEKVVELDLFNAKEISASIDHEGQLTLFYIEDDLYKVLIDLESLDYKRIKVADEVDYFMRQGQVIVFQQESGLYGMDVENYTNIMPLVTGPVKSYALNQDDSTGIYHLITTIRNSIEVDISYVQFDDQLRIENEFILRENSGSSYLQYVKALHADGNILTVVYVWSDNIYGENNVTVHQYDTKTGTLSTDYRYEFSYHRSKYMITDVKDDQVKMLFQDDVHYGVNLVEVIMCADKDPVITPLTKTRKLSFLSKYYTFGEDQGLVFFDLNHGDKVIYFASSNPELIKITTKVTTIDPMLIVGLIMIVIFQAAFTSAVAYLLLVALVPFILLLLINKFLLNFKNKIYIQSAISAAISTGLKLYLTYKLIHITEKNILMPAILGEEPYIYGVMVLLSILSYYLMSRYIKWNIQYDTTPIQSYLYFILFDYLSYTLFVYIYITTNLIIHTL